MFPSFHEPLQWLKRIEQLAKESDIHFVVLLSLILNLLNPVHDDLERLEDSYEILDFASSGMNARENSLQIRKSRESGKEVVSDMRECI
jgi:hypothetical protein